MSGTPDNPVWTPSVVELDALTDKTFEWEGDNLHVFGYANLDTLTEVKGNLKVDEGGHLYAPALTKVGGYLYVSGDAKLNVPALTAVGGNQDIKGKLYAPLLSRKYATK